MRRPPNQLFLFTCSLRRATTLVHHLSHIVYPITPVYTKQHSHTLSAHVIPCGLWCDDPIHPHNTHTHTHTHTQCTHSHLYTHTQYTHSDPNTHKCPFPCQSLQTGERTRRLGQKTKGRPLHMVCKTNCTGKHLIIRE